MTIPTNSGASSSPPSYQDDCLQGIRLFKKVLEAYQETNQPQKKAEFEEVMDEALKLIHSMVSAFLNKEAERLENQVENDYQGLKTDQTPSNFNKVMGDLTALEKVITSMKKSP